MSDEIPLKLLQKLQVQQIVSRQSFFSHYGLHGLDVFPDGVTRVLTTEDPLYTLALFSITTSINKSAAIFTI